VGAAVIWTAQGKYLSLNSTPETAGRHSGIFWAISQACIVIGGIFLYFMLNSLPKEKGASIPDGTVKELYGVFTAITILGTAILALLRLPSAGAGLEANGNVIEAQPQLTTLQVITSTLRLSKTKSMIFLILAFLYTGVELSFWSGIYTTCIGNTLQLGDNPKKLIALNAITMGIGQALAGFLFGILGSKTRRLGRDRIVALGTLVHLVTFIIIYLNFPDAAPLKPTSEKSTFDPSVVLAILCGFMLGFGDACWNTQIFAHLITKYPSRSAQAFSLFKFFQSLMTCAAFVYSQFLHLHWHLLILVLGALIGCVGFAVAELVPVEEEETVAHDD